LGVEGALFQDPAIVDKAKCDTKRIRDVEQGEEPRLAKDQQRSAETMLEVTEPRPWESDTLKHRMMAIHTMNHTWNHKSFLFYLFYYSTYRQIYVTIYEFDTTRDKLRGGKGRASMGAGHRQQEGGDRETETHRGKGVGGSGAMRERMGERGGEGERMGEVHKGEREGAQEHERESEQEAERTGEGAQGSKGGRGRVSTQGEGDQGHERGRVRVSKGEGEGARERGREGVPAEEVARGQEREGGREGEGAPRA
jgi:hypothetical protein